METRYFVGLDLGRTDDFTALAVVERFSCENRVQLRLRHLERLAVGTSYPDIVERVREMVQSSALEGQCELAVNAAGTGPRVLKLLHRAQLGCQVRPVMVSCGRRERVEGDWSHVPNRDLITKLRTLLEDNTLKIAHGLPYVLELLREIAQMRTTVTFTDNDRFDAWREGVYDDMAFAVALACWAVEKTWSPQTRTCGTL